MNRIINCSSYALVYIEDFLHQVEFLNETLEKKKGGNTQVKRGVISCVYLIGVVTSIYFSLMYNRISLALIDKNLGIIVILTAGISTALFFLLLLIRNLLETEYYKVIYDSIKLANMIAKHLTITKSLCDSYYGLQDNISSFDFNIELGEDVEKALRETELKIASLEKNKTENIKNMLVLLYYVAAFAVGAFLSLLMQSVIDTIIINLMIRFDFSVSDTQNWANIIFEICLFAGVFTGPIFARYYFEHIKQKSLTDSLLFLIAFSGVLGFFAFLAVVLTIALLIVIAWMIFKVVVTVIIGILLVVAVIAVLIGILDGG